MVKGPNYAVFFSVFRRCHKNGRWSSHDAHGGLRISGFSRRMTMRSSVFAGKTGHGCSGHGPGHFTGTIKGLAGGRTTVRHDFPISLFSLIY